MKPAGKGEEVAAVEPRKSVSAETSPPESISSIENSDSDQAKAWLNRGNQQILAGDFIGAVASFDKAVQIQSDYHLSWSNRGLALAHSGEYEEAIASFEIAIQIKFDYYEAWYNRGNALAKFGEYKQALESFDQVIQIKPDFHEAWNYRGVILNQLGENELAIASFDQAIQIKPNNHKAWLNRGDSVGSSRHYNPAAATFLQFQFPNISPILPNPTWEHVSWVSFGWVTLREGSAYVPQPNLQR